jgi:hypothetical protein
MSLYILTVDLAHLNALNMYLKYTLLGKEAPVNKCLTEERNVLDDLLQCCCAGNINKKDQ